MSYRTHALSISIDGADSAYPVTLHHIDHQNRTISLSLLDAQGMMPSEVLERPLSIRAECDTEALFLEGLIARQTVRDGDMLNIEGSFPELLHTTSKRDSARISLLKGMQVRVEIILYRDQPPISGSLRNISLGGALLEVPLTVSAPLKVNELIPTLVLVFPNGERFEAMGHIRHVNPAGRSHDAAIGVAFISLDHAQGQRLIRIVHETEREMAYRTGQNSRMSLASPLYISHPSDNRRCHAQRQHAADKAPMVAAIREIARQMHIMVLALQNQRPLPARSILTGADILLSLLKKNRQHFFYAIQCLAQEPVWIQHSIAVAARLGDMMLSEPEHAPRARQAVIAALLHDMGKIMLLGEPLTSLEGRLNDEQRDRLRHHVTALLQGLDGIDWLDATIRHEVIGCINEKLDGSGYPEARTGERLSPVARMASVIDTIDAMTRSRGDRPAMTAIEAYRYLYHHPECFDKYWVTRYIQRHGFYPVGSLVRFSRGYLAWVMALDDSGQPRQVRVVRHQRGNHSRSMNDIMSRADFHQLGQLETSLHPENFQLSPF
ncbi:PilZ domain-containing protein [Kushneria sp. AK178]